MTSIESAPGACPDHLTPGQVAAYRERGYLAFTGLLSADEAREAAGQLDDLIATTAADPAAALSPSGVLQRPGERFHVQFEKDAAIRDLSQSELNLKVRKLMCYCDVSPYFATMARAHPRLIGVVESLIGAGPVLFQDMALVKPPLIGSIKPWHQDTAYFSVAPLELVVGVWIALDHATVENGCMHVLPGGHHRGPLRHHHDRDCEIVPGRIDPAEAVAIELPPGGVLFFAGLLPHETPPNRSHLRRRALQFHYRGAATTSLPVEEYDRLFAEADGSPASCAAARRRQP